MREAYPGYFRPTEAEFKELWDTCIFVPDASTLLNLYRYNEATRNAYLQILDGLSMRLWIPAQVAEEFLRDRRDVVRKNAAPYRKALDTIDALPKSVRASLAEYSRGIDADPIVKLAEDAMAPVRIRLNELAGAHPTFTESDPILAKVEALFSGRVGKQYSRRRLQRTYKFGQARFDEGIPPGFRDVGKPELRRRFGDLILWLQILDEARMAGKPFVFITGDEKEDWFDREGGKTVGPRPELVNEAHCTAGVASYIYAPAQFLTLAGEYLKSPVSVESAHEVARVVEEAREEAQNAAMQERRAARDILAAHVGDSYLPSDMANAEKLRTILDNRMADWITNEMSAGKLLLQTEINPRLTLGMLGPNQIAELPALTKSAGDLWRRAMYPVPLGSTTAPISAAQTRTPNEGTGNGPAESEGGAEVGVPLQKE